jgi:hypothetical protein
MGQLASSWAELAHLARCQDPFCRNSIYDLTTSGTNFIVLLVLGLLLLTFAAGLAGARFFLPLIWPLLLLLLCC